MLTHLLGQCPPGQLCKELVPVAQQYVSRDSDTTYDGYDFAESNQMCSYGYSVMELVPMDK